MSIHTFPRPSWLLFNPLSRCINELETKGRTFFTEVNQHGEGWSGEVWIGDDGVVHSEVSCSGGPSTDYGVKQLRDILISAYAGEWPATAPHFNSCLR